MTFVLIICLLNFSPNSADSLDFFQYQIPNIDSLPELIKTHLTTIARINRISPGLIKSGMILWVPYDFQKAKDWKPIPDSLPEYTNFDKLIYIKISEQWFGAYEYGKIIFSGPTCSGVRMKDKKGRQKYETPLGIFEIQRKELNVFSKKYRVRMLYAMFFYHGFAIHAGILPGYPASGGCVRIYFSDAERLFKWAPTKGTKVIIVK
ncbi:MAG: L,D-transpeptidase family protein [Patescibacteria group bacterium]